MASRAEIIDESMLLCAGAEDILYLLALNAQPRRRAYFSAGTGLSNQVILKVLARLANAGMVDPGEGLDFKIISPEMARDLRARIPDDRRVGLHERALAILDEGWPESDDPGPLYRFDHLIGAERWAEASTLLLDLLEAPAEAAGLSPMQAVSRLQKALRGLADKSVRDLALEEDITLRLLEVGTPFIKPKALRESLRFLQEAGLAGEKAQRLEVVSHRVES
ncbi:MAG: hypothetical protein KDB53_14675, partial [Planctomycetes bacterium]|nr:hypothetical protein [Planctomycetota bacterium]